MARTIKLYAKLDELETEFAGLLLAEFREIADGRSSRFLDRNIPHLFDGKKWRNAEAGHIERVEHDLRTLREQLGEPIATSSLMYLENFLGDTGESHARLHGGSKAAARRLIKLLEARLPAPIKTVQPTTTRACGAAGVG